MGAVICFGSIVSMVLIVLILPVAYYLLFKGTDKKRVKLPASGIIKSIALLVFLSIGTGYSVSGQNVYTLEQCKALAVKNNVTVKNSRLETEASEQTKKAAYTKYFPSVSADVMSLRAVNPLIKANIPSANLPVYNGDISTLANATQFAYFPGMQFSAMGKATMEDVSIVQPVYAGKRVTNGNKLAELGINVSKSKELLSVNEVLQKTEEQYWGVVELNEKMKTLDAYTELLSALYKQANDAFHAGLINRNDVLKVTLKQSETRMNRLKLENGIKLATMALCQYTGIPYAASVSFVDEFNNSQIPDKYFIDPQKAVRQREEYALLQKGVDAEELQTRIKQGEYMPEVGVGISEVYQNITSNNRLDAVAFVSVKIPISGWWEASHTMKERRIQEQIARNDQRNKTELLVLQIQKAWNDLSEAYKQIAVAEETIGQAEENLKVNSDNYKSGIVNISDMLEAQAMLQQSNDQLINARVTYATKLVAYLQATGRYSK
jgi:outer membrane protein TolC